MKRFIALLLCLTAVSATAVAQPAAPALPAAPVAGPLGIPQQSVTVSNKCCSIWDFLGVAQFGNFVNNQICKTQLFTGMNTLLGPLGRALGLGPSLLSDKFAKGGGAMALANQLKKEEKKVPLKVRAIKYLGTLDCQCYPEIVDALLASLDDCSEKVRYAALEALHHKCGDKGCCLHLHKHKEQANCGSCGTCDTCTNGNCPPCDCAGCACQKKVIERLNQLLLARDEFGCLKEKSQRVRSLATLMIEECLVRHQPHPGVMAPEPAAKPDAVPDAVPDAPAPAAPAATAPAAQNERMNIRRMLPRFFGGAEEEQPVITEPAGHSEPIGNDSTMATPTVQKHYVGYRSAESDVRSIPTAQVVEGERVMIAAPSTDLGSRPRRRHLMGEVFGY
jgi:hypothetical protein